MRKGLCVKDSWSSFRSRATFHVCPPRSMTNFRWVQRKINFRVAWKIKLIALEEWLGFWFLLAKNDDLCVVHDICMSFVRLPLVCLTLPSVVTIHSQDSRWWFGFFFLVVVVGGDGPIGGGALYYDHVIVKSLPGDCSSVRLTKDVPTRKNGE